MGGCAVICPAVRSKVIVNDFRHKDVLTTITRCFNFLEQSGCPLPVCHVGTDADIVSEIVIILAGYERQHMIYIRRFRAAHRTPHARKTSPFVRHANILSGETCAISPRLPGMILLTCNATTVGQLCVRKCQQAISGHVRCLPRNQRHQ